jgi:choline dehydrogenase-like flavoprotein
MQILLYFPSSLDSEQSFLEGEQSIMPSYLLKLGSIQPLMGKKEEAAMYDYIIVGAGSAGCVLAHRLVENPTTRVLLLEAGGPDQNPHIHDPHGLFNLWEAAEDWAYYTVPQEYCHNRQLHWPRGKVLGGSSSGILAGISGLMLADLVRLDAIVLTFLVIPAMAAAVVGRLRSLWGTMVGGLLIGVLEAVATPFQVISPYRSVAPFVVAIIVILWLQRRRVITLAGGE